MKVEFNIVEREFIRKDTGEKIKYFAPIVTIDGKEFFLQVRKEDKNLFNYLVKKMSK